MRKTLGKEEEGLCSTLPSGSSMLHGRAAEVPATIGKCCRKERAAANGALQQSGLCGRLEAVSMAELKRKCLWRIQALSNAVFCGDTGFFSKAIYE